MRVIAVWGPAAYGEKTLTAALSPEETVEVYARAVRSP